jgi:hypothetical protein
MGDAKVTGDAKVMGNVKHNATGFQTGATAAAARRKSFTFLLFLAALVSALTQSGCVSLAGSLGLSQSDLNFGKVTVGATSSQSLTVSNSSGSPTVITSIMASARAFTVSGPGLPLTLSQGQSATFTARFAPPAVGDVSGNLVITENETNSQQLSGTSASGAAVTTVQKTILMAGTGVSPAPAITSEPGSETISAGQTATFSVTTSGAAPLSYQWSKNGAAISGATSASYTTPAATAADNGAQFTVAVSNSVGSITSSAAVLTVGSGQLTASATALNYGNVAVGASSSQSVKFTNTGSASLSISNVSVTGAGISGAGVSSGLIIAAGNSAVLNVTFAPSASGTLNGSVTVTSNASDATVTVALAGAAVAAAHSVTLGLADSSSGVAGYNVYRSAQSGGPYTRLNSPLVTSASYVDANVTAAQTYYYVGTSVDSTGDETTYSNQVSATIPAQ